MTVLLDSNLVIYAARPEHAALRAFVAEHAPRVSVVSKVETLGYHRLGRSERRFLGAFFDAADVVDSSEESVEAAIGLRQRRKMSLGDALVAGTTLALGLRLATHNTQDSNWIDDLEVVDPLASEPL